MARYNGASVNQLSIFSNLAPVEDTSGWVPEDPPQLDGIDNLVLDCETNGLKWWAGDKVIGIALRLPNGRKYYLPTGHTSGNLPTEKVVRWAKAELRNKRITNLNTPFDAQMLLSSWGVDLEEQGCTLADVGHWAALLDDHRGSYSSAGPRHAKPFSLEAIAQDYLGRGKVQGLDVTKLAEYPAGMVAPYAMEDCELAGLLEQKMWPLLTAENLHEVRELEEQTIFPVMEMERNAAPIDVELLHRWVKESELELQRIVLEIRRLTGVLIVPTRLGDLERLFVVLDIEVPIAWDPRTKQLKRTFEDASLKHIEHPVVQLVRKARKLTKIRNTYLCTYADAIGSDGLLRYHLHQLRSDDGGTISGRFSASDKNIQQVMSAAKQVENFGDNYIVRQLFKPGTGEFLSADAAQIEFRIFVHFSQSARLIQAYKDNPHISFHNVAWDMIKPYADLPYKNVKNTNFSKLYGGGIKRIASMTGMSEEDATEFVEIYDNTFPEVKDLLAKASRAAEQRGYVKTITGRRSRFPKRERLHKALNGVIQGSAADIMKKKLIELHRERKRTGFIMRMTVHDEVCGDSPDKCCAEQVAEILNRQTTPLRVPILWEVATGANWREAA